jgi:hypothetical protein
VEYLPIRYADETEKSWAVEGELAEQDRYRRGTL